jgi:hypothetical protein
MLGIFITLKAKNLKWPLLMSSVGIQKHFMGAEIPGFGLPNRFFGLTTSCFFRDGIVN